MPSYLNLIIEEIGCNGADAMMIEEIMREDIFHSPLDWQTRRQLREAAQQAAQILAENRPHFEAYFAKTRQVFEEMQRAAQQLQQADT